MILYAESSAVLSWLLGEDEGESVGRTMAAADFIVSSDLTLVECDRVLHRAESLGTLSGDQVADCRSFLRQVSSRWILLRLSESIIARARGPFPHEPVRSLDALHIASALETVEQIPETALLTLDHRVRICAYALGFEVLPSEVVVH